MLLKTMPDPKVIPSTFRFQPQVKDALLAISEREGRSMANMLIWLIKQHCEREGLGWPPTELPNRDGPTQKLPTRISRTKNTEKK